MNECAPADMTNKEWYSKLVDNNREFIKRKIFEKIIKNSIIDLEIEDKEVRN